MHSQFLSYHSPELRTYVNSRSRLYFVDIEACVALSHSIDDLAHPPVDVTLEKCSCGGKLTGP